MTLPVFLFVLAFVFGAVVGSFLNVCICRIPLDESIVSPPSRCPQCHASIRWFDNIPILSYLILRGKCRRCGKRISIQYPLVELLNGLLSMALMFRFGPTLEYGVFFVFCSALVVVTFIDIEHQIIPDQISLPGIVLGFILSFFMEGHSWLDSLLGILLGGGSLLFVAYAYHWLTKKDGMGGGDIKLLAMMGAFLGWVSIPFIIFASSFVGSIAGISLMCFRNQNSKLALPFGPYLAFGALLYIFFGHDLISWYLSLSGFQR